MRHCWIAAACAAALTASGCRGDTSAPAAEPEPAPLALPPADAAPEPEPEPEVTMLDLAGADEAEALRELGALAAWDAVVRRGELLARRGQRGAVHGRLSELLGDYRWLVDETEGAGSLGIRIAQEHTLELEAGARLVAWGAWQVDDEQRWYWSAERLAMLPPRAADAAPAFDPARVIHTIPAAPDSALPVSERTDGAGEILFQVTRLPGDPAASWEIGDPGGKRTVARLRLPGERASYGAQDFRAPDERWHLERGARYVVRVRRASLPRGTALPLLTAVEAPRRLATE